LLIAVSNRYNGGTVSAFDYINDSIARRTQRIDSGSATATNAFGYNPRSELTSAAMGTNAYGYAYDAIGNRQTASNNAEALTYAANALNQYTNITDGTLQVPQYDLDGNLTDYNGWSFAWDGENRLVLASNAATVVSNCYDYMSRRVAKSVNGSARQFLYDGWAMIQETAGTQTNSYVYGLDLSGSMQGAGTIGGILSASLNGTQAFYFYDGNGNVSDLTDASGTSLAHYEWGPYGNATVSNGSLASANPFRFSTKYTDDETGLLYYGFRYYSPGLGRWLNRDPTQEDNGNHLYSFCENNGIRQIDYLGLWIIEHRSSDAYAVARKEAGDSIGSLSIKTGLYASDILGWAKKASDGTSFESYDEVSRACDIYLPNRILLILPKATPPSGWWSVNPFSWEKYYFMLGLRASLNSLGSRWENANFMVEKVDYQNELTMKPTNSQLSWPLLGLVIGGHGTPPLDAFMEGAPRPGSVVVSDDEEAMAPSDFGSASRQYHLQTLVVFACFAGMGGWDALAIGPQAIISISPRRPVFLWEFDYSVYPNRWE
jgi:RHS repeat-associated protein